MPCGPEPQPLRIALLGFLADVAKACEFELDDAALLAEAHPAGRDEAELQRMKVMMRTALRELGPDASTRVLAERGPLLAALAEAAADETFQRAMHARHVLACRTHVPELFASVTELFDDPDQDIKSSALETAVYLSGHSALASVRPTLARRLEAEMPGVTDPSALAVTARLLGMLAASSKTLLSDEHP